VLGVEEGVPGRNCPAIGGFPIPSAVGVPGFPGFEPWRSNHAAAALCIKLSLGIGNLVAIEEFPKF